MISVVIIGKNESAKLGGCLASVLQALKNASVDVFETIFVDSGSEDNSIDVALNSGFHKIFALRGPEANAAVARNTGAQNAAYSLILFVDSDMLLEPQSIQKMLPLLSEKKLVTGWFANREKEGAPETVFHPFDNSAYLNTMGGYFLIQRSAWEKAGGMNPVFRKKQDADFFLRMKEMGEPMYSVPEVLAVHRSKDYMHSSRMWRMLFRDGNFKYRGMLYRKHFFSKALWPLLMRNDYTLLLLVPSVVAAVFVSPWFVLMYAIPEILRSIVRKPVSIVSMLERIPFYFLRDLVTGLSFVFFHPRKKQQTPFEKVL